LLFITYFYEVIPYLLVCSKKENFLKRTEVRRLFFFVCVLFSGGHIPRIKASPADYSLLVSNIFSLSIANNTFFKFR
jgi:hypothetical protein